MTTGPDTAADPRPVGAIVAVRDATFRYPLGPLALDGVSLRVHPGEVLGIAGANGAGKSTLVRLLNGLLVPDAGTVLVDGLDTRAARVADLARVVGLVFQHPRTQLFARTVEAELAFGPRNLGMAGAELEARVRDAADRLGVTGDLARSPFELPAPRRRLVAIAAVLAMAPRVLVLDEPTTGQDARTGDRVAALIEGLRAEGVAVVCVSHDMPLLAAVADRVVAMAAGTSSPTDPPGPCSATRRCCGRQAWSPHRSRDSVVRSRAAPADRSSSASTSSSPACATTAMTSLPG